jgi:hypothetical protein
MQTYNWSGNNYGGQQRHRNMLRGLMKRDERVTMFTLAKRVWRLRCLASCKLPLKMVNGKQDDNFCHIIKTMCISCFTCVFIMNNEHIIFER